MLSINISELIWTIINFFLLYFVLKRFLFDPVGKPDNATAKALAEKLKAGSVTVEMKANGFEHYGPLGFSLERHDEEITAASGDIMLYNGNNICVFYGNNSWSYTPLGKVDGKTADELKAFFGTGSVTVTYSMKQ